ncbi:MAG: peptidoglycan DD-metalloendopeptidase family protein [Acidobacteriota bacterium]
MALLAAGLAFFFLWTPADGQSLETREQELAGIREQIAHLRDRVSSMRSRETSLADRLERVRAELDLQQARLDEANAALALATDRVADAERQILEIGTALTAVETDLRRRMVGLYRLGRYGYLQLFLSMEPGDDLLSAIRQLRFLVRRDRRALDRYEELRADLAGQQRRLEAEKSQVADWQGQEKRRRDQLAKVRRQRQRLLDQVSAERRRLDAQASELQVKEQQLVRFMDRLVADGPAPLSGESIEEFRGVLDWPILGDVSVEFGPRLDPRYKTEVPHNGLEIETQIGDKVRTVYPGEVLYAEEFEGYGPMIVVHHPGRVFTLYAGLRLLSVGPGDVLALGDVIGAGGEKLYFEIRAENEAQNPREWLR